MFYGGIEMRKDKELIKKLLAAALSVCMMTSCFVGASAISVKTAVFDASSEENGFPEDDNQETTEPLGQTETTEPVTQEPTVPVTADQWTHDGKVWCYLDSDGKIVKNGVYTVNNKKYLCGKDGELLTGFRAYKGKRYLFSDSGASPQEGLGALKTYVGFKKLGSKAYYFNKDHSLAVNWKTLSKNIFRFNTKGVLLTGWVKVGKNKYYCNPSGKLGTLGKVLTGKRAIKKKVYYLNPSGKEGSKGKMLKGLRKIGKYKYFFGGNGVMQKGLITVKKNVCYYADSKGRIDMSSRFPLTYKGKQWNVLGGRAYQVKTEAQRTLFRALTVVNKITGKSMSKAQKLKKCFEYTKNAYDESNPRVPHYHGKDWQLIYANDMFVNGTGNCFSYACCFAFLAKAVGYENVYCCNSGGHGWAEINGLVYDPEWSRHHKNSTYFGISYDAKTGVDYRGAISPGYDWMHVKI